MEPYLGGYRARTANNGSITSGERRATPALSRRTATELEDVQRHVLWLSTLIVHHANKVRANPSGLKVGGHQASSASMVTILTELFFDFMRAGDRISVKPHAAPVLQAAHYLLGNLDREYLTRLREYKGLQAYPSRTKDPYPVDFSTGSVGLGSVAPNFAALVARFVEAHFGDPRPGGAGQRFISVVGDAELDEGSIWEAVAEPALAGLSNLIWVVDLNRQSLDRIVPGMRVRQLEEMFRANGWTVIEAKYGGLLQAAFDSPGGEQLRRAIDEMPNEDYQLLLRSEPDDVRTALGRAADGRSDADVVRLLADLGGHDFRTLREALRAADAAPGPAVVFAYTVKGWGLPIAGDPMNHSALLSARQMEDVRRALGIEEGQEWEVPAPASPAGRLCARRRGELSRSKSGSPPVPPLPTDLHRSYPSPSSTQAAFGRILTELPQAAPDAARRLVTVSPDVATSTNLGSWINQVGIWDTSESRDKFASLGPRLIKWQRSERGRHIELGISETNLVMLLGQLGLGAELHGQPLLPIGTPYDPFIARALDGLVYGLYGGGRFILVGTPSGVSLAPEGGAHQSVITPSIGLGLPGLVYYEPCFAVELEWILLDALDAQHRAEDRHSTYLRLSTIAIDQSLLDTSGDRAALRRKVLSGAYRLIDRRGEKRCEPGRNLVEIWASGPMVPEAVRASGELLSDGIYANVVNCVSPDAVYRSWQQGVQRGVDRLRPEPLSHPVDAPVVTVIDGHPSALAWIGAMVGRRTWPLGVTRFGESGAPDDLYRACQIDYESICAAAYLALREG